MKTLLLLLALGLPASAQFFKSKAIYGADNRLEFYQTQTSHQALMRSTFAIIKRSNLARTPKGLIQVAAESLRESKSLCEDQAFLHQPTASECTGFLVTPTLMATAGHCIESGFCTKMAFFVDYDIKDRFFSAPLVFQDEQVYFCKRVVAREETDDQDYALVELDREVKGRAPLALSSRLPLRGDSVFVIGHPSGLPAKLADNAQIRKVESRYFSTNLDTFGGNSGSPVFNSQSHEVEGILVRGDEDYVKRGNCKIAKTCPNQGCDGEEVSLIADIVKLLN